LNASTARVANKILDWTEMGIVPDNVYDDDQQWWVSHYLFESKALRQASLVARQNPSR
jgi:hypothetical protein